MEPDHIWVIDTFCLNILSEMDNHNIINCSIELHNLLAKWFLTLIGLSFHWNISSHNLKGFCIVWCKLVVFVASIWVTNYVAPSNEGSHIVLVWFFLPLPLLLLLLSEACPDHNCLSFDIGQWYLVCGCMTIRQCVAYCNDLRGTLTFDLKVK
jgi:hypothetical protein